MSVSREQVERDFDWLAEMGVNRDLLTELGSCVPGEFTLPDSYYVNGATPRVIYRGSAEGTLPLMPGRWYYIPSNIVNRTPALVKDAVPVARGPRLARQS